MRWVAESKRPFQIVNDRGFRSLMKTGRPEYHIPSVHTVSRDVKQAFVEACKRIAKMLQVTYNKLLYIYKYTKSYRLLGIRRAAQLCHRCLDVSES